MRFHFGHHFGHGDSSPFRFQTSSTECRKLDIASSFLVSIDSYLPCIFLMSWKRFPNPPLLRCNPSIFDYIAKALPPRLDRKDKEIRIWICPDYMYRILDQEINWWAYELALLKWNLDFGSWWHCASFSFWLNCLVSQWSPKNSRDFSYFLLLAKLDLTAEECWREWWKNFFFRHWPLCGGWALPVSGPT